MGLLVNSQRKKYFFPVEPFAEKSRAYRSDCLLWAFFFIFFFFNGIENLAQAELSHPLDWARIAQRKPSLQVFVRVRGNSPLTLRDLALLADRRLNPADRDPGLILGNKEAVFKTTLLNWISQPPLPGYLQTKLLAQFIMTGVYRVGFKVEASGYRGSLQMEVTTPRDGFGKQLLSSDWVIRPTGLSSLELDPAGNRWLKAKFQEVRSGQVIRMHFSFSYAVDMADMLSHDLDLSGPPSKDDIPPEILPFLRKGYKIDPYLPQAQVWAEEGKADPLDARREFQRLAKFIKDSIVYDDAKKKAYFGGQSIYGDLDQMYQEIPDTLRQGKGCCPDTALIECSFLRARGIPCRTAGRFGHFYSQVYIPGKGWSSTSVLATGIPLILSPGPDHVPYHRWMPRIPLRTTQMEARYRIIAPEESK